MVTAQDRRGPRRFEAWSRRPPQRTIGPRTLPLRRRPARAHRAPVAEHFRGEDVRGPECRWRRLDEDDRRARQDREQGRALRGGADRALVAALLTISTSAASVALHRQAL